MNLFLIIGHTGTGKTFFTKKTILQTNKSNYIFDINNEYKNFKNSKIELDFNAFVLNSQNMINSNIIFEDSTAFMSGKIETEIKKIVVKKRHSNNNIFFLFHSIQDTPPFIFRLSNFIILFNTNDLQSQIKQKNERLLKPFIELKKENKLYNKKIIKMM